MPGHTIVRRLFVVPLANDAHGKSSLMRAFVNQGQQNNLTSPKRAVRSLETPWGRDVDALVFIRSYQETLKDTYKTVVNALNKEDRLWRGRELIVLPSHVDEQHCTEMIDAAHSAGFDAIVVPVILKDGEIKKLSACLNLNWDERWTLGNPTSDSWKAQVSALGADLWTWIAGSLTNQ